VDDTYQALIIGFDSVGRSLLNKLIEGTHFVGTQLKISVIIDNDHIDYEYFLAKNPEIKNHYDVQFLKLDPTSEQFYSWLYEQNIFKQIFISTGNDDKSIEIAGNLQVSQHNYNIENVPIMVVTRDSKPVDDNCPYMHFAGMNETILTKKSYHLHQAKAIHHFYNQLKPFAQRIPWEQLSYMKKVSNIAAAESLETKLKLMGKTREEIIEMSEIEFQLFLQENPDRLLNLAKSEHLRWNATYFNRGWKTWRLLEIPRNAPYQNEKQHLHACLVD
jgi:hypothetical protein